MFWDNSYWWPLIGGAVVALGVILFVWPRRYATGARMLMAMMLGVFFWSFGSALEYGGLTLGIRTLGLKIEFLGIASVPPMWLAFTLSYTGQHEWFSRRNIFLLAAFPALTILLSLTNQYHGLLYERIWMIEAQPYPLLGLDRGAWFWIWVGLSYLMMALGSLILVIAIIRSPNLYRKQTLMVLLGAAVPWVSNMIFLSGLAKGTPIDFTPFAFTLTGLFWTWGLFRFRLMDLEPVAHQTVIEGLNEAVFVLDPLARLVNANIAARQLIGRDAAKILGKPFLDLVPELNHLVTNDQPDQSVVTEIESGRDKERRTYEVRISNLFTARSKPMGKVVVLYDITARKETENALHASEELYRLVSEYSQSGIVLVDDSFKFIYANPEFGRIMGYRPEEILGHDFRDFLSPESLELVARRYKSRQTGEFPPGRYTIQIVRQNGAKRVVELSSAVLHSAEGHIRTVAQVIDVTEREEALAALRESEELYRTVFEQSRDVIYITTPDSEIVQFNRAATDMLGYSLEEYRELGAGKSYLDPGQRARQLAILDKEGFIKDYEITLRRKDGTEIICQDTATVWRDEQGNIKGYIGTLRDVTASKKAEQDLRESEERYQRILETSQDPMVLSDMEERVIYLNPSFTRIFGWTLDELKGKRIDFVPQEHMAETEKMMELIRRGEFFSGFETRRYNKSGRLLDISMSAAVFQDRHGNPKGSVVNLRDVTRRKQAEENLRESEEKFRNISANALDGIIMIDPHGRISFWNEAAERMFGHTAEEAVGRDLHLLLAPQKYHPLYVEAYREYQKTGRGGAVGRTLELSALKKGGEEFPVEISISSLWSHNNWHAIGVVRDISERKQAEAERERLEAQLRQAQKMEAVGTLASGVAHDFNNLLQGISGYAQLIKTQQEIDQKSRHYAVEIDQAAQRASDLVTGLLTFGRKVEPELKSVDLNSVIVQSVNFLERTIPRMIEIKTDLAEDLKYINADANQINQVLMNLGANARDAMPEGGRLLFETRNVVLDENQAADNLLSPGDYVRLTISDNGLGMSQEVLKHIFEPFYTTKGVGKGTGLGLSMVYGIINSHGGHISCASERGRGTAFTAYFPVLIAEAVKPTVGPKVPETLPGGSETILVVDDEVSIQETAKEILSQSGYEVIIATSGEDALEKYKQHDGRISMVLMDLSMPGMGGRKALTELLSIDPQVRVIISSGYTSSHQVKECLSSGAAGFIAKPYRMASLLKEIRKVLDG